MIYKLINFKYKKKIFKVKIFNKKKLYSFYFKFEQII